jgi:hypothetical protein
MIETHKYAGERRVRQSAHLRLERDDQAKTNMLDRGERKHLREKGKGAFLELLVAA